MTPKPSVGRIVHYIARGSADGVFPPVCRAAMIAEVISDKLCKLIVFNPSGIFFDAIRYEGEGKEPGTWHWPERDA